MNWVVARLSSLDGEGLHAGRCRLLETDGSLVRKSSRVGHGVLRRIDL
jgi:hypothetical protein